MSTNAASASASASASATGPGVIWFEELTRRDVAVVGGKNASLGEMVRTLSGQGVNVPPGFATTADAYRRFLAKNQLNERIDQTMAALEAGKTTLAEAGRTIRAAMVAGDWPDDIAAAILDSYRQLGQRRGTADLPVAVRSSATAEDLPDASFAGQQETFLNIRGESALLDACRRCYASLFTDRAITYRRLKGFEHQKVALSVGVQQMVRSDIGGAGVMFSLDTELGFDRAVLINAAWGLGENVVQGAVNPDEYQVFKPLLDDAKRVPIVQKTLGAKERKMIYASGGDAPTRNVPTSKDERARFVLTDAEILQLARDACTIERHYGQAMDMEWARDGETGDMYIVQARPETVQSQAAEGAFRSYEIKTRGKKLLTGLSIGEAVVTGQVCLIEHAAQIDSFVDGSILVTSTTDPDWVPVMKRAAAIVTDHGGRTSHAAIVSRELGLPAIVGTGTATHVLHDQQEITVSCAEGEEGFIYEGSAEFEVHEIDTGMVPQTRTKVMLNLANPSAAFRWWRLPDRRRRPRAHGVRRLEPRPRAPDGAGPLRRPEGRGGQGRDRTPDPRLRRPARLLRRDPRPRPVAHRRRRPPEAGHRPHERLQDERVRQPPRRPPVRARGGKPDDRVSRRVPLLFGRLPRGLRARMPRHPPPARGDGLHQRRRDDPLLPHAGRGGPRPRRHGRERPPPRRQRPSGLRDVRDSLERHPGRGIRPALRRLLDRLERPDPADAGRRPRLRASWQRSSTSATRPCSG